MARTYTVYRRDANEAGELRELRRSGTFVEPICVQRKMRSNHDAAMLWSRLDGVLREMVTLHRR